MSDKRNAFLDAGDSDEDVGRDYGSEDDFQKGGPSAKRRRVNDEDSEAEDITDDERYQDQDEDGGAKLDGEPQESGDEAEEGKDSKEKKPKKTKVELPGVKNSLLKKNLVVSEAAIKKSGVIYLSRVPPFMKPQKLRSLLEPYGQINRIFLAPEDPAVHARRVHAGGNKKRSYGEGWVEFIKKKDAKKVVDLLNAQTIGGKKSSWYRDDVWAMKYLNGFKWWDPTPLPLSLSLIIWELHTDSQQAPSHRANRRRERRTSQQNARRNQQVHQGEQGVCAERGEGKGVAGHGSKGCGQAEKGHRRREEGIWRRQCGPRRGFSKEEEDVCTGTAGKEDEAGGPARACAKSAQQDLLIVEAPFLLFGISFACAYTLY